MRVRGRSSGRVLSRLRCERGQSLLEFALVVPLFLALVCGIVEFAHLYYVRLTVRDIAMSATRFAVTGRRLPDPAQPAQNLTRAASVDRLVRDRASQLNVAIDSVRITPTDGGDPGEVVQVRVFYRYRFTAVPLNGLVPSGSLYYSAASAMRNEPAF